MEDVELVVRTVLADVLGNGVDAADIHRDRDMEDYGLDSLKGVSLLLGIEDALGVELRPELLETRPCTVRTVCEHLQSLPSRGT
ncbi:acyl carrier protein [Streptomyces carminius]|uniref:Acyl carrier protein n=1 Tax=Streptomyces carminius TaxID=2665496 RepID=A0A2M8LSE9_9ACTN|nr:acyl carrier protein [Streptomyces carminius]PJE94886.1 acyl carrier protein [Streptomyces carminius]